MALPVGAGRPAVSKWITLYRWPVVVIPSTRPTLQALCRSCHFAKTAAENREANPPAPEVQAWRDLVADLG